MRILFDNGTPRGVASILQGHTVEEARSRGWDTLRNGELLDAAEAAGFDVFLTIHHRPESPAPAEPDRSNHRNRRSWQGPMEADQEQASGDCRGRGYAGSFAEVEIPVD